MQFKVKQALACAVLATLAASAAIERNMIESSLSLPHLDLEKKHDVTSAVPRGNGRGKVNFCKRTKFRDCKLRDTEINRCCKPTSGIPFQHAIDTVCANYFIARQSAR